MLITSGSWRVKNLSFQHSVIDQVYVMHFYNFFKQRLLYYRLCLKVWCFDCAVCQYPLPFCPARSLWFTDLLHWFSTGQHSCSGRWLYWIISSYCSRHWTRVYHQWSSHRCVNNHNGLDRIIMNVLVGNPWTPLMCKCAISYLPSHNYFTFPAHLQSTLN